MATFKVVIVGGGLAGALLANGLLNNGIDVEIYEQDPANSKREGYHIRLGDAAEVGFKACLKDDVWNAIHEKFGQSAGTSSTAPTISNSRFETVLDLTKFPNYAKSAAINRVVLREILLGPIKAAGRVYYEKRFSKYTIIKDSQGLEKVQAHFVDGSVATCDILIGADGSRSEVNHQLGARNLVNIDSHMCFVNKGSLTWDVIDKLPASLQTGPLLTFTKDTNFYFALYLPSTEGKVTSISSKSKIDLNQGSFYWCMLPKKYSVVDADTKSNFDLCQEQVKDWHPAYTTMINAGTDSKDSIVRIPLRASNSIPKRWRQDAKKAGGADSTAGHPRVWLMGDAIHAMQPNRGMGGNQAMMDTAEILPELLKLAELSKSVKGLSSEEISAAVTRYEDKMFDCAFNWVKKSGSTSVPTFNLDGPLGTLLKIVGKLVSVYSILYYALWPGAKSKPKQE